MTTTAELRPTSPGEVIGRFQQVLAECDVDALLELYEPNAAFRTQDGVVHGHGAIRRTSSSSRS